MDGSEISSVRSYAVDRVRRRAHIRAVLFSLKLSCSCVLAWGLIEGAALTRAEVYSRARRAVDYVSTLTQPVIRQVLVSSESAPTKDLIQLVAAENHINPVVIEAIIDIESEGKSDAIRFEPVVFSRINRRGSDEERMLASSHGLMQVMGYHAARTCGLKSWAELYEPIKNLRCGTTIIQGALRSSASGKSGTPNLREALVRYNGIGERAELYANKVMERIGEILINKEGI